MKTCIEKSDIMCVAFDKDMTRRWSISSCKNCLVLQPNQDPFYDGGKMEDFGITEMIYGKYRGELISQIPSSYLKWVAETWDETDKRKKHIVWACDKEWEFREKTNTHFEE